MTPPFDRREDRTPLRSPASRDAEACHAPASPWPGRVAHPFDPPPSPEAKDEPWPRRPRHPTAREPRATAVDIHVGARVRQGRLRRGLSQGALAETLGITFQQVQRYEQGTNRVGASRLFDLATALAMPIAFFFDGVGPERRGGAARLPGPGGAPAIPDPAPDSPERKETLDLIRTFDRILDDEVRRQVLSLVRTIAQGEGGRGATPGVEGTR